MLTIKVLSLVVGGCIAACAVAQLRQEHVRRVARRLALAERSGIKTDEERRHRRPMVDRSGPDGRTRSVRNLREQEIEAW